MVSLIYECLGEVFHGSAVAQFLYLRKASEDARRDIRKMARLIVAFPFEELVSIYLHPRLVCLTDNLIRSPVRVQTY